MPELQHGHGQSYLPAVRGGEGVQEQPGPAPLRTLPAAALTQGVSRLLPADQTAYLPAADQASHTVAHLSIQA